MAFDWASVASAAIGAIFGGGGAPVDKSSGLVQQGLNLQKEITAPQLQLYKEVGLPGYISALEGLMSAYGFRRSGTTTAGSTIGTTPVAGSPANASGTSNNSPQAPSAVSYYPAPTSTNATAAGGATIDYTKLLNYMTSPAFGYEAHDFADNAELLFEAQRQPGFDLSQFMIAPTPPATPPVAGGSQPVTPPATPPVAGGSQPAAPVAPTLDTIAQGINGIMGPVVDGGNVDAYLQQTIAQAKPNEGGASRDTLARLVKNVPGLGDYIQQNYAGSVDYIKMSDPTAFDGQMTANMSQLGDLFSGGQWGYYADAGTQYASLRDSYDQAERELLAQAKIQGLPDSIVARALADLKRDRVSKLQDMEQQMATQGPLALLNALSPALGAGPGLNNAGSNYNQAAATQSSIDARNNAASASNSAGLASALGALLAKRPAPLTPSGRGDFVPSNYGMGANSNVGYANAANNIFNTNRLTWKGQ